METLSAGEVKHFYYQKFCMVKKTEVPLVDVQVSVGEEYCDASSKDWKRKKEQYCRD